MYKPMHKLKYIAAGLLLALVMATSAHAQSTVVIDPSILGLPTGANISTYFPGVTLSAVSTTSTGPIVVGDPPYFSSTSDCTTNWTNGCKEDLVATFTAPVGKVSIDFYAPSGKTGTLTAYNSANTVVGMTSVTSNNGQGWVTLTVDTTTAQISSIRVSLSEGDDYGYLNNLVLTTPFPPPPPSTGAKPFTKGYWKNHVSAWPITTLQLGGRLYTQTQLLEFLGSSSVNDASLILSSQLIAALLNSYNGSNWIKIASTITAAQAELAAAGSLPALVPVASPLGQAMVATAAILDKYNNNKLP